MLKESSQVFVQELNESEYQITFDGTGLSSGIYIYRITSSAGTLNRKMIVTK